MPYKSLCTNNVESFDDDEVKKKMYDLITPEMPVFLEYNERM